ncbi:hypothetical protein F01_420431 [Burkholderia cenocepacia]|nr:hypothetical protein F01_420431 [Burkholderia cenocepacia]
MRRSPSPAAVASRAPGSPNSKPGSTPSGRSPPMRMLRRATRCFSMSTRCSGSSTTFSWPNERPRPFEYFLDNGRPFPNTSEMIGESFSALPASRVLNITKHRQSFQNHFGLFDLI